MKKILLIFFFLCLPLVVWGEDEVMNPHTGAPDIVYNEADEIITDTTNFDNNLSATDTDVQTALETLDDMAGGGATDKISEGDSNVEVIDTGTGQVDIDVDATLMARLTAALFKVFEGDFELTDAGTDKRALFLLTTYNDQTNTESILGLYKSHSDTAGALVATIDNENIGGIIWKGVDSGNLQDLGARIDVTQVGAAGTRVPCKMAFSTYSSTAQNANQFVLKPDDTVHVGGSFYIPDDTTQIFGSDDDWTVEYDEGVDNQLLFLTANTACTATNDPMFEILVGASPTANQQLFGVSKGIQASNTNVLAVDEDGDFTVTGYVSAVGPLYTDDNGGVYIGTDNDIQLQSDTNAAGDDLFEYKVATSATFSAAIMMGRGEMNGDTAHDNYTSPTLVPYCIENADTNDYSGMVIGFADESDVVTDAPRFYLYGMTGARDNTPDATSTELAPIIISGDDKTVTSGHSLGAGDWVHGDDIEIDGMLYTDGGHTAYHGTADAALGAAGEWHINETDDQVSAHFGSTGEISGEASISGLRHLTAVFDPDAICDGNVDRVFLMTVGDDAPEGVIIVEWKFSFEADPTTEADIDLKRADAFIGVANAAVMDVMDTTNGTSSEDTNANINSGNAVANGKVIYLEFGTAYTETTHQCIFEMWFYNEED